MSKSKYYQGIPSLRRPIEDEHGREILDPKVLRTAVDDVQTLAELKRSLFVNNRVADDSDYIEDEHIEDTDGVEFEMPGLGRYEEYAMQSETVAASYRKNRAQEIANENQLKRERYEQQQREAAKAKYGLVDRPAPPSPKAPAPSSIGPEDQS